MIAALLLSVLLSTVTLDVLAHRRRPVLEDRSRGTYLPAPAAPGDARLTIPVGDVRGRGGEPATPTHP